MASRLLFVLFSVLAVSLAQDLNQNYRFSVQLDGEDYVLYWNFSYEEQSIQFAVRVKTTGWIGFGLSPNGQMPQSDVVIGWVDNNGQAMLQDRFADGRNTPAIDALQSWNLVRGVENNGSTVLEFWRNFSTCDDRDREISKYSGQTYRIIWSYYPDDPTDPTGRFRMHTRQGNKSLHLLGRLQRQRTIPSDSETFIVRNDKVTIPNNTDFTYWCSYQEHSVPPGDIYIYKATPLITTESVGYIQHMTFAVCPSTVDPSLLINGPCNAIQWLCYYGDGLPGWTNGGGTYTLPEDVALHIQLQSNQRLFMQVHYDNPRLDAGVIDSSGMMFHYTRQRPVNIAGSVAVEFTTFPFLNLVIPPNAESFNITATCPNRCHDSTFPQNGITIFSTFHFSNAIGKASIARRSRQADGCDAVEELEPINQNLQIDFKFQEYTHLQKPIVLQKGDTLSVTCTYDSKKANRQGVTLGGQSRRDEQCVVFFGYYPKIHLTYCGSYVNPQSAYAPFLRKVLPEADVNATLQHLNVFNPVGATNAFNRIQWTPQNISDFQQAIEMAQTVNGYCWYDHTHPNGSAFHQFTMNQSQPRFDCPYQYPNRCARTNTMSCCDRLRSGQLNVAAIAAGTAGGVVGLIIAVIVVAVIVVVAIIVVKGMAKAKGNQGDGEKYSELVRKDSYKEEA